MLELCGCLHVGNFCLAATIAVEASEAIQAPGMFPSVLITLPSLLFWGFEWA